MRVLKKWAEKCHTTLIARLQASFSPDDPPHPASSAHLLTSLPPFPSLFSSSRQTPPWVRPPRERRGGVEGCGPPRCALAGGETPLPLGTAENAAGAEMPPPRRGGGSRLPRARSVGRGGLGGEGDRDTPHPGRLHRGKTVGATRRVAPTENRRDMTAHRRGAAALRPYHGRDARDPGGISLRSLRPRRCKETVAPGMRWRRARRPRSQEDISAFPAPSAVQRDGCAGHAVETGGTP